jgi:hypothetical protein
VDDQADDQPPDGASRHFTGQEIPVEDFYESRYIKMGQTMRDIDRIADSMVANFTLIPAFEGIEAPVRDFANTAKIKTETLRTDPDIFDVWSQLVTAGERLANFTPRPSTAASEKQNGRRLHSLSDGLQLLRNGRDLVFYLTRARTPMPKTTREYIERCAIYLATGRVPFKPAPLPA